MFQLGMFFLATLLALLCSTVASAQQPYPIHEHPYEDPIANSESDRFIGTLFLVQCNKIQARRWLTASIEHNPHNKEAVATLLSIDAWTKLESARAFEDAIERMSTDLREYHYAISCDANNLSAIRVANKILEINTLHENLSKK